MNLFYLAQNSFINIENDRVLISGFGRKGHAVGDNPGDRLKTVRVADIELRALFLR